MSESRGIGHGGEASSTVKSKRLFPPRVRQTARWMTKRTSQEPREGHKMAAQWDVFSPPVTEERVTPTRIPGRMPTSAL